MVLQVGTTNFQSTSGESSRTPVQRGIREGVTPPKTGMMELADTLKSINPTLQKFVSFQIDKAKQQGVLEGQNQILGSTPTEINKIKKELEAKEGKRFARNFIGGNIYTQYGIEKQLAINLGNASEAKTKKFFNDYVVDVPLPDGTVIQQPLSQFDINSKEFQGAINEFQQTSLLNTRGIRPEIVNEHLLPKQNFALAKIFSDQETKRAEAKIEQANLLFNNSVINSWFSIDNFNDSIELNLIDDNYTTEDRRNNNGLSQAEFLSLQELQLNVDSMVKLGLSESVSPASLIDIIKTNTLQILNYYESNNLDMDVAEEEITDYINWIGNLKVTNGQPLRNFYISDGENKIETLMSDINKKKSDAIKNQKAFQKQQNQETISNTLNNLDFSRTQFKDGKEALSYFKNIGNTLDALANEYPEQIEFLYKEYDLRNFSVDDFFFELETAYDDGTVTQSQALIQVTDVMQALGPNASKADRDKYTKLKKYLGKTDGKSLDTRFPEMKELIKYGQKTIGKTNLSSGVVSYKNADDVDKMEDLNTKLKSLVKENEGLGEQIEVRDQKSTVRNWYLGELRKIKNPRKFGKYEFYDPTLDLSQPIEFGEVIEKDDGDGQDDKKTVNIQEQKVLTYDTTTKLFSEVNTNELQVGPNTTLVSINGSVTPAGESLRQNLKIKSFENFNIDFYNATFEDNKTKTKNENLLKDDLAVNSNTNTNQFEAGAFSDGGFSTVDISSGDTLSGIANDFGVSMEAIMKANGITNANQIDIGDILLIPEGIKDLNKINFIENLDKTKIISEQDHPYAPVRREHNFKVILDLAKAEDIKYPELVAAQAMHESAYGNKKSSKNNFLGIKATTSEIARGESEQKDTTEDRGKGLQGEKANFKKFENLKEMIRQYKIQWNNNFEGRKGTVNADTVFEALKLIKAEGYATDKDYVTKVINLLNDAKTQGWY